MEVKTLRLKHTSLRRCFREPHHVCRSISWKDYSKVQNASLVLCCETVSLIQGLASASSAGLPMSCHALFCPLLRSAAHHIVAPMECDDHGLDKALHSWPLVPLWKSATGSLDYRVRGGRSPSILACPVLSHQ